MGIFTLAAVGLIGKYFHESVSMRSAAVYEYEAQQQEKEESKEEDWGVDYKTVEDAYQYLYEEVFSLSYPSSSRNIMQRGISMLFWKQVQELIMNRKMFLTRLK